MLWSWQVGAGDLPFSLSRVSTFRWVLQQDMSYVALLVL